MIRTSLQQIQTKWRKREGEKEEERRREREVNRRVKGHFQVKRATGNGFTLAVNGICSAGFALSAMPFIDDALLWCPDNDGRLVGGLDLATCITVRPNADNSPNFKATFG